MTQELLVQLIAELFPSKTRRDYSIVVEMNLEQRKSLIENIIGNINNIGYELKEAPILVQGGEYTGNMYHFLLDNENTIEIRANENEFKIYKRI
jgi:hypothetical protein